MIRDGVTLILEAIEGPLHEGTQDTPDRVARAYLDELFSGYGEDPEDMMTTFEQGNYDQMVIVSDIPLVSTCMHHILPFTGVAHVGYLPKGRVVGLSKIPRLVEIYSRRLQIQEQLTSQIADAIQTYLNPMGVMVVITATHSCMCMRGVKAVGSLTTTSMVTGVFLDDSKNSKEEFLRLIGR